jgi:Fe-S oxidoreductase
MNWEGNVDNLEETMSKIVDSIHACRRCKMCVDMCPTHEGWLTQSSMGRLAAIYLHFKYEMGDEEELSNLLYSCASCRRCEERCKMLSVGVSPADIIIEARQVLVRRAQMREKEG